MTTWTKEELNSSLNRALALGSLSISCPTEANASSLRRALYRRRGALPITITRDGTRLVLKKRTTVEELLP